PSDSAQRGLLCDTRRLRAAGKSSVSFDRQFDDQSDSTPATAPSASGNPLTLAKHRPPPAHVGIWPSNASPRSEAGWSI
ncbi:hypothetical protein PGTUg99_029461, partial [Puccinia graminis f. sp. tritici]